MNQIEISDKSEEIASALVNVWQAEAKLREALRGVTALDIEHGLGANSDIVQASSADLLLEALKSEPNVTEINAKTAFGMIPSRAQARFRNQAGMGAAIRVLKKKGVLSPGKNGMWAVCRDQIC